MIENYSLGKEREGLLKAKCGEKGYRKLAKLNSPIVTDFIAKYLNHCNPDSAFVRSNAEEDAEYIRKRAVETGEEKELAVEGHTVHFDGYCDQARDKENTKFLIDSHKALNSQFNTVDKEEGLREIHDYMKDVMEGSEAYICFFCLGPPNSRFSIPGLQITDSPYVVHSEDILYRDGYELFKTEKFESLDEFFKFVHSEGALEGNVSKNIDKRRIYTDLDEKIVYSVNTQYGGNTIGLKKLALRLAIKEASDEGWLAEHMFIVGVRGPNNRTTYFTGAFPSACGKTSTAMIKDASLVGDDIAYLREVDGELRAANPEVGIFGIIRDVNQEEDPLIWKAITSPKEAIFSNVLVNDGVPYWLGMEEELPEEGINYSGAWFRGKKNSKGREISPSHLNARYTLRISDLGNKDPKLDSPEGFKVEGIIYGGRDSDTWAPVEEAFDWKHGVITKGAALESETTKATLGKSGERKLNPMSNLDFLSIPIGKYISNYLRFGDKLDETPQIFSVNYFLLDENGEYLSEMHDKQIWLKWMELRVHKDVEAIKTPTGYVPRYEDLRKLFKKVLGRDYSKKDYVKQFTLRVPEHLSKIARVKGFYEEEVRDPPESLFEELERQELRLKTAREKYGDYISPDEFK